MRCQKKPLADANCSNKTPELGNKRETPIADPVRCGDDDVWRYLSLYSVAILKADVHRDTAPVVGVPVHRWICTDNNTSWVVAGDALGLHTNAGGAFVRGEQLDISAKFDEESTIRRLSPSSSSSPATTPRCTNSWFVVLSSNHCLSAVPLFLTNQSSAWPVVVLRKELHNQPIWVWEICCLGLGICKPKIYVQRERKEGKDVRCV